MVPEDERIALYFLTTLFFSLGIHSVFTHLRLISLPRHMQIYSRHHGSFVEIPCLLYTAKPLSISRYRQSGVCVYGPSRGPRRRQALEGKYQAVPAPDCQQSLPLKCTLPRYLR